VNVVAGNRAEIARAADVNRRRARQRPQRRFQLCRRGGAEERRPDRVSRRDRALEDEPSFGDEETTLADERRLVDVRVVGQSRIVG
jgi:hypothetical protein